MKLTFLGTSSGMPVLNRRHSALLVEQDTTSVLLDVGEGVCRALMQRNIDTDLIQKVFISHTHADHVIGLPMFLMMEYLHGRTKRLQIFCPDDRCDWLERTLHGMFIFQEKWTFPFEILPLPLSGDQITPDVTLRFFTTHHLNKVRSLAANHGFGASSYGFLLSENENQIVISSDVHSIRDIDDVCGNASLLVIEATHVPVQDIFHFTRNHENTFVIVTHIAPELEKEIPPWKMRAEEEFGSRLTFAEDGLIINTLQEVYGHES